MDPNWSIYSYWTAKVLNKYKENKEPLHILIEEYLEYASLEPMNKYGIESVSRIWWVTNCSLGTTGILHFLGREDIPGKAITEIARAAGLREKALRHTIEVCDNIIDSDENTDGSLIIMMSMVVPYLEYMSLPIETEIRILNSDLYDKLYDMEVKALHIGADAWREAISDSLNDIRHNTEARISDNTKRKR